MITRAGVAARLLCLLIGYGFGMIQTAFIYGKLHGTDIRTVGSGNAGTTNALRSFGLKVGAFVAVVDVAKGVAAVLLCRLIFAHGVRPYALLIGLYAGFGCILGHNFPVFMKFKGGKGVACTAAVALMFDWKLALIVFAEFFLIIAICHYVSAASLSSIATFVALAIVCGCIGLYGFTRLQLAECAVILILTLALGAWQHRTNIGRLIRGCERKTYLFHRHNH